MTNRMKQSTNIELGKRIVPYDMVLGVDGYDAFNLKKDEILIIVDIDKYGRGLVWFRKQKIWMWATTIDRISNKIPKKEPCVGCKNCTCGEED